MRKIFFLSGVFVCVMSAAMAQTQDQAHKLPCYSDEMYWKHVAEHPELIKLHAEYEKQIEDALKKIDYSRAARTTDAGDNTWYDIPVVIHVIHDYNNNQEYIPDDSLFNDLLDWNRVYAKENADTSVIVAPYNGNIPGTNVRYAANARIRLHLATVDPYGNPTKGITRRRSYLTYTAGDQAKYDQWPPANYMNIWVVNLITIDNGEAAAYAQFPDEQSIYPYYDGVISDWAYVSNAYTGGVAVSKTINHELGHCFNLLHPWNNNSTGGAVATSCGDDDVDDTPPTKGHAEGGCRPDLPASNANSLFDTACATNYFKIYTNISGGDSIVNYPDTTNTQNIMDYTYCSRMFTAGQVARMHATLNSAVASRNNLWDPVNLANTGALAARPDLKPIPEFSATKSGSSYMDRVDYFTFPGTNVTFNNETWNDTLDALTWTFSNGASVPTSNSKIKVVNTFSNSGWVTLSMTATGNHTGDSMVTWNNAVYVTDATGTPGASIMQEFSPATNSDKWPSFNYYNNEFKWQIANTGIDDGYSMEYLGYDTRLVSGMSYPTTGEPQGDFDDFFSVPVDLSAYSAGNCSLNFDYSGASRSSSAASITDEFDIDYTINNGTTWINLVKMTKGGLENKGTVLVPYAPLYAGDWAHKAIDIPASAITNYTTFRFRYKPGIGVEGYSSGNNFYIDRISFSQFPASVGNVNFNNSNVVVAPNPASGDAYVIVKGADNTMVNITVTDITGRVVYTAHAPVNGNTAEILIPHTAVGVKGMYLVQTTFGSQSHTSKLVVD